MKGKDNRRLIYTAMFLYIIIYYIFNLFSKTGDQHFEIVRISFETIALIITLLISIKLNVENNKKSLILPTVLIDTLCNFIGQIIEIYQRIVMKTNVANYLMKDTLSVLASILFFIVMIFNPLSHIFLRKELIIFRRDSSIKASSQTSSEISAKGTILLKFSAKQFKTCVSFSDRFSLFPLAVRVR